MSILKEFKTIQVKKYRLFCASFYVIKVKISKKDSKLTDIMYL
jgi:hypothetical protein